MKDYMDNGGKSRGSALYSNADGKKPYGSLPEEFRYILDNGSRRNMVQEVMLEGLDCSFIWRNIRAIPEEDDFFENVWRSYRENGNTY